MKIIIFAGGTGKRFWPVSRKDAPKQFLNVVGDKPLLRARVDLLLKRFSSEDIFISTGKRYEKEVLDMLPDIPKRNLIFEPEMRDTGPAVTLAVNYVDKLFPDEVISVQWSDDIINNHEVFLNTLDRAEKINREKDKIIFLTVPARLPTPHLGYIHFGKMIKEFDGFEEREFIEFKEKPDIDTAISFVQDGYYGWNPGHWVLRADQYNEIVEKHKPELLLTCKEIVANDMNKESLSKFSNLEKISADYLFAELVKPAKAEILLTRIGWNNVGEWVGLKESLEKNSEAIVTSGNVIDLASKDSIFYNYEEKKLIATIGLKDMVVINTKDVVAVFKKEDNGRLKEYLKMLEDKGLEKYL